MSEPLCDVLADAESVFGYDRSKYYTDRAHAYIREREVSRTHDDTAVLCVVRDLIGRAAGCEPPAPGAAPPYGRGYVDGLADAMAALAGLMGDARGSMPPE